MLPRVIQVSAHERPAACHLGLLLAVLSVPFVVCAQPLPEAIDWLLAMVLPRCGARRGGEVKAVGFPAWPRLLSPICALSEPPL